MQLILALLMIGLIFFVMMKLLKCAVKGLCYLGVIILIVMILLSVVTLLGL